jgi:endonuclease-3
MARQARTTKKTKKKTPRTKSNPSPAAERRPSRRKAEKPAAVDPATKRRAARVYRKLNEAYPDARCALNHARPFELLVATILSAQCTDDRVNKVTPKLFRRYPDPAAMADAKQSILEEMIRSTGFFRNKARSLREASRDIVEMHGGEVPRSMEELTALRGVARKTANVVLGNAWNINEGVVVDTHVQRLSQRLGFTEHKQPNRIERDLMALFPREDWTLLSHLLIWHGRAVCQARRPDCANCCIARHCPKVGVEDKSKPTGK